MRPGSDLIDPLDCGLRATLLCALCGVPISHQVVPLKRLGVQVNQAPNVSIRRYFPIRESVKALFQADVTNLFNNVVFGGINTTVGNANFGTVSSQANSSRDWQLVGQIEF
ncbi:MAG TPA: hypothetical protein VIJ38_19255 [Acidobacteriaceae bacterium]